MVGGLEPAALVAAGATGVGGGALLVGGGKLGVLTDGGGKLGGRAGAEIFAVPGPETVELEGPDWERGAPEPPPMPG